MKTWQMDKLSSRSGPHRGEGIRWLAVMLLGGWLSLSSAISAVIAAPSDGPLAGMVAIPGGMFTMGRDDGPQSEQPAHQLFLPTFYIDQNLVTVAAFAQFVQVHGTAGPSNDLYLDVSDSDNRIHRHDRVWLPDKGSELYPVGEVSWSGAMAYCNWRKKRLPSEAEWEKAARGTDGRLYPWGNHPPQPDLAFFGGFRGETRPVGQYPKGVSPYGIHDMAGQVWEWTTSIYQPYPYKPEDGRESVSIRAPRVARGGHSSSSAQGLTSTSREVVFPVRMATGHAYIGFRCAKSLETLS